MNTMRILMIGPGLWLSAATVALAQCGSPSSSRSADSGPEGAIAALGTLGEAGGDDGGTCAACVTDRDCQSCGSTTQPGYVWCCGGSVGGCYQFSTSCPTTPEDSGGDVAVDGQPKSASCPGSADGGDGSGLTSVCSSGGCVGANWAEWPMPNSSVDVVAGAPNLESYTINGDGTVTDDVTSLMWQQVAPSISYTWADAQAYCTSLTLGGHGDWRLATIIELISIVDYSQNLPAIDRAAFPGAAPTDVWTSTSFASSPSTEWEIYFAAGDTGNDPIAYANFLRCARGPAPASAPALPTGRYTVANGMVYDTRTRLTWQQAAPSGAYAWADARSYCASLSLNGAGGWRVPTAKELLTIVDVTKSSSPAIDCEAFPGAHPDSFWSSTPFAGFSRQPFAWAVYFDAGHPISVDVTSSNSVRCVR